MDNDNHKIPNISLTTFSSDGNDFNSYEGIVLLDSWKGFQSRQGSYGAIDSREASNDNIKISVGDIVIGGSPKITEEHINAYRFLTEKQGSIKDAILTALLSEYPNLQEQYDYDPEDSASLMPDINSIDDFKNLIWLSIIHVLNVSKDGIAYVGYEFGCAWDDEHGLGIMTHKDRVIEMGGADASFLEWIAERDLNPEKVNAEIEASYKLADNVNQQSKKPWWKFW